MTGWAEFAAAYAVFLGSHMVPARPALRERLIGELGRRLYLALYAAVSVAALAWLFGAAARAPYAPLWDWAPWRLWVPNLVMPAVCALIAFGAAAANPLSFGGARNERFDPERPGVAGVTRHPLLWALALWSGSHLVPNGDLAHVLLFGGFAVFSLLGMAMIDRRKRGRLGPREWRRLARRTSLLPFGALLAGRWRPRSPPSTVRVLLAVALWALLFQAHAPLIGVSPVPPEL